MHQVADEYLRVDRVVRLAKQVFVVVARGESRGVPGDGHLLGAALRDDGRGRVYIHDKARNGACGIAGARGNARRVHSAHAVGGNDVAKAVNDLIGALIAPASAYKGRGDLLSALCHKIGRHRTGTAGKGDVVQNNHTVDIYRQQTAVPAIAPVVVHHNFMLTVECIRHIVGEFILQ